MSTLRPPDDVIVLCALLYGEERFCADELRGALTRWLLRIDAIRALRLNYTRRGVYVWLRGRKRSTGERGWRQVWRDPASVIIEQHAIAEGVMG